MTTISTEGRIFVAQLTRDLVAREAVGAALLAPGSKRWEDAFRSFTHTIAKADGPIKAAAAFRAGILRLGHAQKEGACFINSHMTRKRSGGFELLTWEVDKHPLLDTGHEGVVVHGYLCSLQRIGCVRVGFSKLAFCSWHSLARIRERSEHDLFDARGIVVGCGVTGMLMRESAKHANTGVYYAAENLLCAGVLRVEPRKHAFFDVLTALPHEDGLRERQWAQGCAISHIVWDYLLGKDADPEGLANDIDVLPYVREDYITRELKRAG